MPDQEQVDEVIERARQRAETAKRNVETARTRLDRCRASIVRPDGSVRRSLSAEAVARAEELAALERHAAEAEAALTSAVEDLPRRRRERARALEIEAEVRRLDAKAERLREQLDAVEKERQAKTADAALHRTLAAQVAPVAA